MNTVNRLFTLFRGQVRRQTEAVLDSNALALLDQQLFDTEQGLIAARRDLASLMAERALAEKQHQQTSVAQQRYEQCALKALTNGDEALAEDTAARVAELEQQTGALASQIADLQAREREFRQFISDAGATLRNLRQQQAVARVADRMQGGTRRLGQGQAGLAAHLDASRDTLARIQQRQDRARAQWRAEQALAQEASGEALDQRLEAAGLMQGQQHRKHQVMARLREKLGSMDQPPGE